MNITSGHVFKQETAKFIWMQTSTFVQWKSYQLWRVSCCNIQWRYLSSNLSESTWCWQAVVWSVFLILLMVVLVRAPAWQPRPAASPAMAMVSPPDHGNWVSPLLAPRLELPSCVAHTFPTSHLSEIINIWKKYRTKQNNTYVTGSIVHLPFKESICHHLHLLLAHHFQVLVWNIW